MAVKQIGLTRAGTIKSYMAEVGDVLPITCGPGSEVLIIDPVTHTVTAIKIYDGTNWNEV